MVECTVIPRGPLPILRVTQLLVILVWVVTLEALSLTVWPHARCALPYVVETTIYCVPDSTQARLSSMGN